MRNQIFLQRYPKKIFSKKFTLVLLDGLLNGFSKFRFFIVEICILIWDFGVIFENYNMRMLSIRWKRFYRILSIRGRDFIAYWAYDVQIFAHAQPAVKCEQFLHVNTSWAKAEQISSHTEHTPNEFHRWLSMPGMDFIAGWAYAEIFKSRISRPNRIWFSKISC